MLSKTTNEPFELESLPASLARPADAQFARSLRRLACLTFTLGLLSFAIDLPTTGMVRNYALSGDLKRIIEFGEMFGHAYGSVVLFIAVFVLDPASRIKLPRAITGVVLAGLTANLFKLFVTRSRPRALTDAFNWHGSVWDTFGPPLQDVFASGSHSIPSGHSAAAGALAAMLAWLYPRGRYFFAVLALLVALQRVFAKAHFVSDTWMGLTVGLITASWAISPRGGGRLFTRMEDRHAQTLAAEPTNRE